MEAPAGSRPSVARPSRSWSRLAGPALPPEAAGGGVCAEGARHGAGPTRPAGPEGPGRRAAAAAGERAGPPGGGRGAGPPGRGHRFWGKYPTGERGATRPRPSSGPSSSRGSRSLPWGFISCLVGAGSPPTALCSRFAFSDNAAPGVLVTELSESAVPPWWYSHWGEGLGSWETVPLHR